jgi:hypothetical protein
MSRRLLALIAWQGIPHVVAVKLIWRVFSVVLLWLLVAGGASCAARLRRLDEKAEIIMVERGPYVSYANCGLPYHIGGMIEKESSLLVGTEQMFRLLLWDNT